MLGLAVIGLGSGDVADQVRTQWGITRFDAAGAFVWWLRSAWVCGSRSRCVRSIRETIDSTLTFENGVTMPQLGLGTYKSQEGDEVREAVEAALRLGYRSIDTASVYGNEAGIGEGLRRSGVSRDDVFLTTKVWNDEQGYDETLAALGRSLERLGTGYVDLYLVHWPVRDKLEATWRAMEDALAEGLTRAIGVCNHLPQHLAELLAISNVPPAVDQIEFHPWLQQPSLQAFLAEHDIALEAWAPLLKGRAAEEPTLVEIGERLGVSPAQVAVRWVLQQGYVVIPKSVHAERIAENADVFDFELTDRDMERIGACDHGRRLGRTPTPTPGSIRAAAGALRADAKSRDPRPRLLDRAFQPNA